MTLIYTYSPPLPTKYIWDLKGLRRATSPDLREQDPFSLYPVESHFTENRLIAKCAISVKVNQTTQIGTVFELLKKFAGPSVCLHPLFLSISKIISIFTRILITISADDFLSMVIKLSRRELFA